MPVDLHVRIRAEPRKLHLNVHVLRTEARAVPGE